MNRKFILVLPLLFTMLSCNKSDDVEVLSEYDFVNDFADKQGFRGWYYFYGDTSENLTLMTYHEQLCCYKGADFWSKISPQECETGLNTETIIGWKAPKDTTISVTFTIERNPPDGFQSNQDGLWIYSYINDQNDDYLFSEEVRENFRKLHTMTCEVSLKKNDMFYVVLNPNNDNNNDNSICREHIVLK